VSPLHTAETFRDDRVVPEPEVERRGPETMSFQPREAGTVVQGPRRRGSRSAGRDAGAGQSFAAREAGTVTLRPPHWEGLTDSPAPAKIAPETAPDGPQEDHRPEACATEKES